MESKTKSDFKAVDFMRKIRNELSDLYHDDKERFHKELKKTMNDFLSARKKASANIANSGISPTGASVPSEILPPCLLTSGVAPESCHHSTSKISLWLNK